MGNIAITTQFIIIPILYILGGYLTGIVVAKISHKPLGALLLLFPFYLLFSTIIGLAGMLGTNWILGPSVDQGELAGRGIALVAGGFYIFSLSSLIAFPTAIFKWWWNRKKIVN